MRILALIRHYPPPLDGGAYYYNYHLCQTLSSVGVDLTIVTHGAVPPQLGDHLEVLPISQIKTGRYRYRSHWEHLKDILSSASALRRIRLRGSYDYLLCDAGYLVNLVAYIATWPDGPPIVGINYSEEITVVQRTTRLRALLQRFLLHHHYYNIVCAKTAAKLISDIGVRAPNVVIYPSVLENKSYQKTLCRQDLVSRYGVDPTRLLVGFLGRHTKRKGIKNLIMAVKRLSHTDGPAVLLIGGTGEQTQELHELIDVVGCGDICRMIGPVPESEKHMWLSGIDVFAMPNIQDSDSGDTEGFPIVFLEAAQNGTPVIGGRDGGVPEAISHGVNGFVVNGNSVDEIVEALKAYANPTTREKHGNAGKQWSRQFDWVPQVGNLATFLSARLHSTSES